MKLHAPKWAELESGRIAISRRLSFAAQVVGWLAVGVGVVVLVAGWWLGHPAVASLIPGQVTMKANAAVGIGLSGLVLVGVARDWKLWIPGIAAAIVLLVGAVTVGEYIASSSWSGFDELLAAESVGAVQTAFPGRMGVNTAFDYVLLGIAGILLTLRKAPNLRQVLSAAVIVVAVVALMG